MMLTKGQAYTDQGQDYCEERCRERVLRALSERAAKLGMQIVPIAQAAGKTSFQTTHLEGVFREAALCIQRRTG